VVQEVLLTGTHKGTEGASVLTCEHGLMVVVMMMVVVMDHQGNGRATSRRGARSTVGW
jgi:hypothetical protein